MMPSAAATFMPPGGTFTGSQQVQLSTTTPGATIHYTTDGSEPTASSPVYTGPIAVDSSRTVRAITVAPGMTPSSVTTASYAIEPPPPAAPQLVAVKLEKIEIAEKVFFDTGKTTIQPASFALLSEVAMALKSHPEVKRVVIEGHTDTTGPAALNAKLSQGRAEAVRAFLVEKGVEGSRLEPKGFGGTRPIGDNNTAKGRDANRRVEFVIER
jgi:outer membrane protein OmpA-like peptidoglycan-associated protein